MLNLIRIFRKVIIRFHDKKGQKMFPSSSTWPLCSFLFKCLFPFVDQLTKRQEEEERKGGKKTGAKCMHLTDERLRFLYAYGEKISSFASK